MRGLGAMKDFKCINTINSIDRINTIDRINRVNGLWLFMKVLRSINRFKASNCKLLWLSVYVVYGVYIGRGFVQ
jgi:hypothetical protein